MKVRTGPTFRAGVGSVRSRPYLRPCAARCPYMSLGLFVIALTVGAALLAVWTSFRFPRIAPETLRGALVHVAVALLAGWFLVPAAVTSVVDWVSPTGPLVATLLFVLPALTYLFLATLWAMRMLQELMQGARR
jgi:hypothetical protein